MALGTVEVVGTAIFSDEPAELASYYERVLGINLEHRAHGDGREHWITNIGQVHFEIKATRTREGAPTPDAVSGGGAHSNIELSFRVDDPAGTFDLAIEAGGRVHQPLIEYRWGAFGVVLDPDG